MAQHHTVDLKEDDKHLRRGGLAKHIFFRGRGDLSFHMADALFLVRRTSSMSLRVS